MVDGEDEDAKRFSGGVGERLRAARIGAGLDIADVASRTRVPQRHLEAIEAGNYEALPSVTYSIGFAKAYARTVGLSEAEVGRALRAELEASGTIATPRAELQPYEPADPAREPTRLLAWTAAIVALLVLVGYGVWRGELLSGGWGRSDTQEAVDAVLAADQAKPTPTPVAAATPVVPTGAVVLTANDTVWLRIYDGTGTRLFEKQMAAGERYEVPADANNPQILTGRPQALDVTVGGQPVPPLGPADRSVKDLGISAAALTARFAPAPAAQGAPPVDGAPTRVMPVAPAPRGSSTPRPVQPGIDADAPVAGDATTETPSEPTSDTPGRP